MGAAAVGYVLDLLCGTPKGLMTFLAVAAFLLDWRAVERFDEVVSRS